VAWIPEAWHERPGRDRQRDQHPRGHAAPADGHREDADRGEGRREPGEPQVVGVEDRDDHDAEKVVDHGEGEQERAQRRGQAPPEDGQHRDRERDVGGHGDGPAAQRAAAQVDQRVDPRGHGHAADRREDRDDRRRGPAQLAVDHLALELETDDEEEDRQQAVGRPLGERQVEVQRRGADDQAAQRGVPVAPGGVRPAERDDRAHRQQDRAGVLGAQVVREVALAARRQPGEQAPGSPPHRRAGSRQRTSAADRA
jgi:hypothetical protein